MSWNARLIDGPHEGRTVVVEEEDSNDPPASLEVDGQHYLYCGFADNVPRYKHDTKSR